MAFGEPEGIRMANGWTCARCGAPNDDAAVSCRSCGLIRGGVVTTPNQMVPPPAPTPGVPMAGVPAPGGYPGAPAPVASSTGSRAAIGCLANVGIRLAVLGAIVVIALVVAYVSNAGRDASGNINKAGDMKAADLQVGDCYDLPSDAAGASAVIENTHAVPCREAHHYEVFYRGEMSGDSYPTDDERHAWARANCVPAFESYVGTTVDATSLGFYLFYPDSAGWTQGDRGAQCSLADANDGVLTGSLKGSKR